MKLHVLVCLAQTMEAFECEMCHCENPQDQGVLFECKCNFPIWNALIENERDGNSRSIWQHPSKAFYLQGILISVWARVSLMSGSQTKR